MTIRIMMSIRLLKIRGADLESRKRLDTIQEVEQNSNSIALFETHNELTRRETELNKAREEAKKLWTGLSESDRILQGLTLNPS